MVRRTDPKDDNWLYVKDAKKRKQIQDRLAQRARRKEQTRNTSQSQSDSSPDQDNWETDQSLIPYHAPSTSSAEAAIDPSLEIEGLNISGAEDLLEYDATTNTLPLPSTPSILNEGIYLPLLSPLSQPNTPFTVFSALYINGKILGIRCATTYSSRTPPPTPDIPLPLHATDTQRLILHPRWFDRFPFPKMRDSLIKLQGVIDEEELVKDIFTMPSWRIVEGRACWDPRAWKMEREWATKWGWLMY
ncbi:hypothetical protein N0V83_010201 [Neocucurbitaria cava]|uniref:Uncharacterized protein n=1 Tax=Neocucurbitaria cava TaxID=798079 RepID=A0A9W8Y1I2_9PLEO|nr:hypothetical protein N0V83_010201 [Neocucurbitaria cava]